MNEWRSGLYARPPTMDPSDTFFHGKERKYSDLKVFDPCTVRMPASDLDGLA